MSARTGRPPLSPDERRRQLRARVLRKHERWTPALKADVCRALQAELVTVDEVIEACAVTRGEMAAWAATLRSEGADGLRVTPKAPRARA